MDWLEQVFRVALAVGAIVGIGYGALNRNQLASQREVNMDLRDEIADMKRRQDELEEDRAKDARLIHQLTSEKNQAAADVSALQQALGAETFILATEQRLTELAEQIRRVLDTRA